ncbi:MAG: response regulator transcription factor, partial [Bdellovibrionales bacterium]|nr:response regulator transcription factor [Bdellovibrionales bacterium]
MLTELERQRATVLLCHPDQSVRLNLRRALEELKFKQISEVASHGKAIELLKERHFSHILFDSTPTNVDPSAFVLGVLRDTPETILLALSNLPEAERIFALLQCGTRGYLILPASKESLLESVIFASKG